MGKRSTYVRPKPSFAKAAGGCLWLLFLLGAVTTVITAAIMLVTRAMS